MMNAQSMPFSKLINIDQGAREHYHVPKYQREYTWGKSDWARLMQDIDENDPGYFMGSIICVKDGDSDSPGDELIYDVVDGQQRLTTLSILMMAIYDRLRSIRDQVNLDDEEDRQDYDNALSSLRNKLVKKKKDFKPHEPGGWVEQSKMCFLRVQPSSQNHNLADYKFLLGETDIIKPHVKPSYHGIRLFRKAFNFFQNSIPDELDKLQSLVGKINQLNFVHISVPSHADAFTLFETLNNRGVPLSAIDIIKNKMLAEMEKQSKVEVDASYEQWQDIISAIPDTRDQERFLRHFYHANRWDRSIRVEGIARAIKSKIIVIYERLIKADAQSVFMRLCEQAGLYGHLIGSDKNRFDNDLAEQLADLARINASPAYQVLLYLFSQDTANFVERDFLSKAVDLLRRYYIRRNVTDYPSTRDLDQNHMDLIDACQMQVNAGNKVAFAFFRDNLLGRGRYSPISEFEKALSDSIYSTNILMTRYLLVKLDEAHHTREYAPDLWARDEKGKYVWTVEHVLPQSENISPDWLAMIAEGDLRKARQVHEDNVHRLGNLTLSGYNSKLATSSFAKKQMLATDRQFLGHKINLGYKNGLAINNLRFEIGRREICLADAPKWTAEMIDARTDRMVNMLLEMYKFEDID